MHHCQILSLHIRTILNCACCLRLAALRPEASTRATSGATPAPLRDCRSLPRPKGRITFAIRRQDNIARLTSYQLILGSLRIILSPHSDYFRNPDCTLMTLACTESRWQVATLSLSKSTIGIAIGESPCTPLSSIGYISDA